MIELSEALAGERGVFELALQIFGEEGTLRRIVETDAFGRATSTREEQVRIAPIASRREVEGAVSETGEIGAYATRRRARFLIAARYLSGSPRPEVDLLTVGGTEYRVVAVEPKRICGRVAAYEVGCVRE